MRVPLRMCEKKSSPYPGFAPFPSRRSCVHSLHGIVACTQPLAAEAGQRILRSGGNAADAAVAVAAALNVTEPQSTGLGGDMFCLFYDAKKRTIGSINGSGRSAAGASVQEVERAIEIDGKLPEVIPMSHALSVTTPGTAAGWLDSVKRFGSGEVTLKDILQPAIELAEGGFPVSELTSRDWQRYEGYIRQGSPSFRELLKDDIKAKDGVRAPRPGEVITNLSLARSLRLLVDKGKEGFYKGPVAQAIAQVIQDQGGFLSEKDLLLHLETGSENTMPISLKFTGQGIGPHSTTSKSDAPALAQGIEMWEHPPNGQGLVALMALGILEELEKQGKIPTFQDEDHNSASYIHALVEALRIAFADGTWFITDSDSPSEPVSRLLSPAYLAQRASLYSPDKTGDHFQHGDPQNVPYARRSPAQQRSDTVYLAVTDRDGNACSFINSIYGVFGSGIIPKDCGFILQSRGSGFHIGDPKHPNAYAPKKRPYHTIIPSMLTDPVDNSLHSVFGVMGGFMQPQGHVQVFMNMLVFGYNPQAALDAPRFCIGQGTPDKGTILDTLHLEEGVSEEVAEELRRKGHKVEIVTGFERSLFGRGQIITSSKEDGKFVFTAGSDQRGDGAAMPG